MVEADSIEEFAERVDSLQELQQFLGLLERDHAKAPSWGNDTLADYLSGASLFSLSVENYYRNRNILLNDVSAWRVIAKILLAGRVYDST